jgi:hypothetical protein
MPLGESPLTGDGRRLQGAIDHVAQLEEDMGRWYAHEGLCLVFDRNSRFRTYCPSMNDLSHNLPLTGIAIII